MRLSGGEKPSADRLAETKVQGCQNRNFPGFSRPQNGQTGKQGV